MWLQARLFMLGKWSITGSASRTKHIIFNFCIISRAVCKVAVIIIVVTKLAVAAISWLSICRFQIRMTKFGISIDNLIIRTIIMTEIRM